MRNKAQGGWVTVGFIQQPSWMGDNLLLHQLESAKDAIDILMNLTIATSMYHNVTIKDQFQESYFRSDNRSRVTTSIEIEQITGAIFFSIA